MKVLVRLPGRNEQSLPILQIVLNGITVIGSIVGTRLDLAEVFELHAAGRTRVIRDSCPLDDVNDALARVLAGHVPARLVFDPRALSGKGDALRRRCRRTSKSLRHPVALRFAAERRGRLHPRRGHHESSGGDHDVGGEDGGQIHVFEIPRSRVSVTRTVLAVDEHRGSEPRQLGSPGSAGSE